MSGNNQDNNNDGLMVLILILAAIFIVWYFFGKYFAFVYIIAKKGEFWLCHYTGMGLFFPERWEDARAAYKLMSELPEKPTMADLRQIGAPIGFFSKWYYMAIIAIWGINVYQKNPIKKFKNSFTLRTLVDSQKSLWTAIAPVSKVDIIGKSIHKGEWAMGKRPLDFARYYQLLEEGNKVNRPLAEKLFASQLGKLWEGPNKLPPITKALFAVFAAQATGDLKNAEKYLSILNQSFANNKPDYTWVNEAIKKYESHQVVKNVCSKHSYVYTVMPSLLLEARKFGVLASAQFIWLRPKNRVLWYILNNVGRQVAWSEVGGIYAHWIAENVAGHGFDTPFVIKAVDGLEKAIAEVKIDDE